VNPQRLVPNLIDHFYAGGAKIAALRGIATTSPRQPEEWVGATVARNGDDTVGLARIEGGALLRDLVLADPTGWRGVGTWPGIADSDTGVLLKLLDAGQRLPVHVHPDRAFAASHLDCPYGKTEAWYVLDADPGAAVHLGWTQDVDPAELVERREAQDGEWMLDRMHRIEVRPGDGILVPAGFVHAIGAGVFVAEAQEPSDFSILLEWSVTTSGREDSHLGLGFDRAMQAVSHRAVSEETLATLIRQDAGAKPAPAPYPCLPDAATPFFRLDRITPSAPVSMAAGFAAVVVLDGAGRIAGSGTGAEEVRRGETWVVPAGFGDWTVAGDVTLLVARPGAGWPADLGGQR
jgi:mannose-6-phosphate isomerase